jgi:hypothetical protein
MPLNSPTLKKQVLFNAAYMDRLKTSQWFLLKINKTELIYNLFPLRSSTQLKILN